MEYLGYLFVTPWKLMSLPINIFGYIFTLRDVFLLAMIIGVIGFIVRSLTD